MNDLKLPAIKLQNDWTESSRLRDTDIACTCNQCELPEVQVSAWTSIILLIQIYPRDDITHRRLVIGPYC
jgi:hypothetical protein